MANYGHGERYEIIRRKLLFAAAKLFLTKGYVESTLHEIHKAAGTDNNAVIRTFGNKEGLLAELVAYVLEGQFQTTKEFLGDAAEDKILYYAAETTLQLYMAESSEHIRNLYLAAYSLPKTTDIIQNTITGKLEEFFQSHLPECDTKDFYMREIASGGIMRNFLAFPCSKLFSMEEKVRYFLENTFKIYDVPKQKIDEAIKFVSTFDYPKLAQQTIDGMLAYLEANA